MTKVWFRMSVIGLLLTLGVVAAAEDVVKIGVNYPQSGAYAEQGKDQWNAAKMAAADLNAAGGILGKKVVLVERDSKGDDPKQAVANAEELFTKEGVTMFTGGISSALATAVTDYCQSKGYLYMAAVTASNAITCEKGHRCTFRYITNAWMGGNTMAGYLNKNFKGKKYFYIVADYAWGHSTEASLRTLTGTEDTNVHKSMRTPFPKATEDDFKKAVAMAKMIKPDVLVTILFGQQMADCIRLATMEGLKETTQIVVPIMELNNCIAAGPKVMENVVGALDWCWEVPYKYNHASGKAFVEKYVSLYNKYPCWTAVAIYNSIYGYAEGVKKAGTFDTPAVITALEGLKFSSIKDNLYWRDFDHQMVQSCYMVKGKPAADVAKDKFKMDYFEILDEFPGEQIIVSRDEWNALRQKANLPTEYEPLPASVAQTGATQSK